MKNSKKVYSACKVRDSKLTASVQVVDISFRKLKKYQATFSNPYVKRPALYSLPAQENNRLLAVFSTGGPFKDTIRTFMRKLDNARTGQQLDDDDWESRYL